LALAWYIWYLTDNEIRPYEEVATLQQFAVVIVAGHFQVLRIGAMTEADRCKSGGELKSKNSCPFYPQWLLSVVLA
jgi:hypothetical protein